MLNTGPDHLHSSVPLFLPWYLVGFHATSLGNPSHLLCVFLCLTLNTGILLFDLFHSKMRYILFQFNNTLCFILGKVPSARDSLELTLKLSQEHEVKKKKKVHCLLIRNSASSGIPIGLLCNTYLVSQYLHFPLLSPKRFDQKHNKSLWFLFCFLRGLLVSQYLCWLLNCFQNSLSCLTTHQAN